MPDSAPSVEAALPVDATSRLRGYRTRCLDTKCFHEHPESKQWYERVVCEPGSDLTFHFPTKKLVHAAAAASSLPTTSVVVPNRFAHTKDGCVPTAGNMSVCMTNEALSLCTDKGCDVFAHTMRVVT